MQRLKILGIALIAVFALSVVVSATVSAAVVTLPEVTTEERWTGESGKGTLEVLRAPVSVVLCAKDQSEGIFEAKKPLGRFHIDFSGCKIIGVCTGLGEALEVILALGVFHLVFDKLGTGAELGVGILLLIEPVHFQCGSTLFTLGGQLLCLIKPPNVKVKHFEIVCKPGKEGGDPGETVYWNEEGVEVKMGEELFLIRENEGAGVMSSESRAALILTINEIDIMG